MNVAMLDFVRMVLLQVYQCMKKTENDQIFYKTWLFGGR